LDLGVDVSEPSANSSAPESPGRRRLPARRARDRFISDPGSGRNAILVIIVAQLLAVLIGGAIVWMVDRQEFENLTEAFWYVLQTITTVGYGDVTPVEPIGRLVGAVIMLLGIAFVSILTASITSSFIDARQAARRASQQADLSAHQARLEAQLDAVIDRLDRIERATGSRQNSTD
jgi:voltage-gated potassium channel